MPIKDTIVPLSQSRTLMYVGGLALLVGVYSVIPVLKEYSPYKDIGDMPSQFHAALSLVLGWLLVFRTNSAYARWWEARTLWGGLINASRNLSLKVAMARGGHLPHLVGIRENIIQFSYALKDHLRNPRSNSDAEYDGDWVHMPMKHVHFIYDWLWKAKTQGEIDGDELRVIDMELAKLLEICGGCERIAKTLVVRSYRVFARQCVTLFLFTLPWGIANDFGWWTVPLTIITSYFMLGLEIVAEHVEAPFGSDEDDLDLDGMCHTIETSVNEAFQKSTSSIGSSSEPTS